MTDRTARRGLSAVPAGLVCDDLVDVLRTNARLSEQSERRLLEVIGRFLRFLDAAGVGSLTDVTPDGRAGVRLCPERDDGRRAERRDVASSALGGPIAVPGSAPGVRSSTTTRPSTWCCRRVRRCGRVRLTDDEIALGRSFSLSSVAETRRPAAWALAEATARTSEMSNVCVRDLDLDAGRVWLAGGTKVEPRRTPLTPGAFTRSSAASTSSGPTPAHRWSTKAQAQLRAVRRRRARRSPRRCAGPDSPVSPMYGRSRSSAWAGRQVFEETGRDRGGRPRARDAQPRPCRRADRLGLDGTSRADEAEGSRASRRSNVSRRCSPIRRCTSSPS